MVKTYVYIFLFLINILFISAQNIDEVETFGIFNVNSLEKGIYAACIIPSEYKTIVTEEIISLTQINDTFRVPKLYFVPAIYDTIGWDTISVFEKYFYYSLKKGEIGMGKDTSNLHFWRNNKEIWVSKPIFKTVWKSQNVVKPYLRWEKATKEEQAINCISYNPDDCFILKLKEATPKILFSAKELVKPSQIRIKEGLKDTTFALFPPSPYLKTEIIPAQYLCMPILKKRQAARIDTTWETKIVAKEILIDATHQTILVKKEELTELKFIICSCPAKKIKINLIKKALKENGFYQGEITNELDEKTKESLIHFQETYHLQVGKLDRDTLEALGIDIYEE